MTTASTGISDFQLTEEDLKECGWQTAIRECEEKSYSAISQSFFKESSKADSEGRGRHSKTLWVLGHFCGMRLAPSDYNDPFKVNSAFEVARSVITNHLRETGTATFEDIFSSCENLLIKARIADFLWLVPIPRDPKFALAAIDAYRAIPLTTDSWVHDASKCWRRALSLARTLGRGASDRWTEMEFSLFDLLTNATSENLFFGSELADILKTYDLARSQVADVAEKLDQLAGEFEEVENYYAARRYFSDAAVWFKDANEEDKMGRDDYCRSGNVGQRSSSPDCHLTIRAIW